MKIWDRSTPVHKNVGLVLSTGRPLIAQAAVPKNIEDLMVGNPLRAIYLHLPIRRYVTTARNAAVENALNDAQIRAPIMNHMLKYFKAKTDEYAAANDDTEASSYVGGDIRSQFDIQMILNRNDHNGAADYYYALPPRRNIAVTATPVGKTAAEVGQVTPLFQLNADLRTRELIGFQIPETSMVGKQLAWLQALPDNDPGGDLPFLPPAEVLMIRVHRSRRVVALPIGTEKNDAVPGIIVGQVNTNGWYPNQANGAVAVNAATEANFDGDNTSIIILFVKASLAVGGNMVTLDHTAKYIYNASRYGNQVTINHLNNLNDPAAVARHQEYLDGGFRFQTKDFKEFVDFGQVHAVRTYGAAANDLRLFRGLAHHIYTTQNTGFLSSIADVFYNHRAESQNADGTWNLTPDRALRDVYLRDIAIYGGINPILQPQVLYYWIDQLPIPQPDGLGIGLAGAVPWVLPVVGQIIMWILGL